MKRCSLLLCGGFISTVMRLFGRVATWVIAKVFMDFGHFYFDCGGGVFLLGFLQKNGFGCGVFVVKLWWFAW